ncbi:hypothetical protein PAPYR_12713 [Paratrimastix pyriformis]|uniref:TmcB/TmcC TPR repeats domain-containing protein n=1 Tax=Paratrimastix pyriformis TaxID=342808 RepID=A0ABQ8U563_9EUKA|nr:hypothetical protein PAPYR_12713 [Paratrimastix pyriformis]
MKADNALPRIKWVIFVAQSIQLFLTLATIPPNPVTSSDYVKIPLSLLDFSFALQAPVYLYATFGVCAVFVLLSVIDAFFVGIIFQKEDNTILWPLKFLRVAVLYIVSFGFIPIMGTFLEMLDCRYTKGPVVYHDIFPDILCWGYPHAIPSVVAIIMICIFLPSCCATSLLVFGRGGFDGRSRGRFDLFVIVGKALMTFSNRLTTDRVTQRSVINCTTLALFTGVAFFYMPYYRRQANAMSSPLVVLVVYRRYSRLMAVPWPTLRRLLKENPFRPDRLLAPKPVPLADLASPSLGAPGAAGPPQLTSVPSGLSDPGTDHTTGTATNAPPVLATALLYLRLPGLTPVEAVTARWRWSMGVEWSTRFLRWKDTAKDPRLVSYAEAIYSKGLAKFPESHGLLLDYADFLQVFQKNAMGTIVVTRKVTNLPHSSFDTRFMVYAYERDFETQASTSDIGSRSAHVMSMLTYRRHMRQAQMNHKRAKRRVAQIWAYLMRPSSDVGMLPSMLEGAVKFANFALETYSALSHSFPNSIPLLRGYGALLQDLYGETDLADSLLNRADMLEEEKNEGDMPDTASDNQSMGTRGMGGGSSIQTSKKGSDAGSAKIGGQSLMTENDTLSIAQNSVISFLANRHTAASAEGGEDLDEGGTPGAGRLSSLLKLYGWLFFFLHLLTLAGLAICMYLQSDSIQMVSDAGFAVRATSNASVLVEQLSYYAREVLQLAFESSQPPLNLPTALDANITYPRVVLSAASLLRFKFLVGRAKAAVTALNDRLLKWGAWGDFGVPWATWPVAVVQPVVTKGSVTALVPESMSLFTLTFNFLGRCRRLSQLSPEDLNEDPVLADLVYMVINGPNQLGPTLVNMSIYSSTATSSADFLMVCRSCVCCE